MQDPLANAILERIEDAGYTVSRTKVVSPEGTRYVYTATRSTERDGLVYRVDGPNRRAAADALARAVGLEPAKE